MLLALGQNTVRDNVIVGEALKHKIDGAVSAPQCRSEFRVKHVCECEVGGGVCVWVCGYKRVDGCE